ncbi:c-type cytochrome [Parapedobacter indicus]|uniref:Cytochrome c n=1 Tax=Parapedobacter indicus TaxID=1477437 RepID=A0A1I3CP27_9SPHI|nr:c-type cytochrome [Parapedobacter indicus]PPL04324.1 cytochrome c [Parapedobacter indicus]SFH75989.1 Cytochrome c [Parapedobacter indicus]
MKFLKVFGIVMGVVIFLALGTGLYVNFAMPNVGDAPDIKVSSDSASIERGEYLAMHVAVCMDCHSQRNWHVFSGPITKGTEGSGGELFAKEAGFPGTIYSTNLTPYGLSDWTDGEIYRAVTAGVGKDGRALFPVMGYHRFGQMDKADVYSIIAYLRTLPAVKNDIPAPELDFPVNLLNKLSPSPAVHQLKPLPSDTTNYGAYLVNVAGCVDCHSKQDKGQVVPGSEFGGGMEFRQPAGVIRAPNITMHPETGIGAWTKALFVNKFKAYADSSYHPKPMAKDELNSPMPWTMYAGMSKQDLEAIYVYLKSLEPKNVPILVRSYAKR